MEDLGTRAREWLRLASGSGPALSLSRRVLSRLERERPALNACARSLVGRLDPGELTSVVIHRLRHAAAEERARIDGELDAALRRDEHTLEYALSCARAKLALMREAGVPPGARILELGAGASLGPGLLYVVHGAASYTAVDLVPPLLVSSFYRRLRERLGTAPPIPVPDLEAVTAAALRRFDAAIDLGGDVARLTPDALDVRWPVDAADLPFPDASFDVVLSNAAFEHFDDPDRAIRETLRVLRPGGVGLHQIDLRDHRDFAAPLAFLSEDETTWRARFAGDRFNYTNRWRMSEFTRAFERAGFDPLAVEPNHTVPVGEAERAAMHADFRDRPLADLETVAIHVRARRPS